MLFDEDTLYILIEGEPNSPEVGFIDEVIKKLQLIEALPSINYDIEAVGGSELFNSFARLIYHQSNFHSKIPVLAIRDRDYRKETELQKHRNKSDENLLNNKSVRYLYWDRHEWENFLLEETETLAQIFNAIPVRESGRRQKLFKRNSLTLTKSQLDSWLQEYFQGIVIAELVECLKFRFYTANICPQLENPTNDEMSELEKLRHWFKQPIIASSSAEKLGENLQFMDSTFDNTLAELDWSNWFNNPLNVNFDSAKEHFRGKEAFFYLFNKISAAVGLVPQIKNTEFINHIFLPELERNLNCFLIRQIQTMLFPYFQKVTDS